jgi:hypothetical protein
VRFAQGGAKALVDGSRAPHSTPQRTEEALERLIVSERRLQPTWEPKKLRVVLERKHAIELPPLCSKPSLLLISCVSSGPQFNTSC